MTPASILDAVYALIAGLPGGPTQADAVTILSASFPDAAPTTLTDAVERALNLKWSAYTLYANVKKRILTEQHAQHALRTEQPGFSDHTYGRAWADGRLGNAW